MGKPLLSVGSHRAVTVHTPGCACENPLTFYPTIQHSNTTLSVLLTPAGGPFVVQVFPAPTVPEVTMWQVLRIYTKCGPSELNTRFMSMKGAGYSAVLSQGSPDQPGERVWGGCGLHQIQPPLPKTPNHGPHLPTWQ